MTWNRPFVLAFALLALPPAVRAQDDGALEERVGRLVAQLGHENFEVRERASRQIQEIGADAIPYLEKALASSDPEVRSRVQLLIDRIPRPSEGLKTRQPERRAALLASEGGEGTEEAVAKALAWLARHQGPGGDWDADAFEAHCKDAKCDGRGAEWSDVGQTGLALLAFLGAGQTHRSGDHREAVRKGIDYLVGVQDGEGCLGLRKGHFTYNHAIGTLALVECAGLDPDERVRAAAGRAVAFLLGAQNPGAGWRYGVRPGDNDTSITGWAVQALLQARALGLEVPASALDGARRWFDGVTDPEYYRTGYIMRGDTGARLQSQIGKFAASDTCTAIGLLARIEMGGDPGDELAKGQAELLAANPPRWDEDGGPGGTSRIDVYYWYHGALATFQVGGPAWRTWSGAIKDALVPHQRTDGEAIGSWDPVDAWGTESGRVATTALAALTLETYYRYPRRR